MAIYHDKNFPMHAWAIDTNPHCEDTEDEDYVPEYAIATSLQDLPGLQDGQPIATYKLVETGVVQAMFTIKEDEELMKKKSEAKRR